MKGNSFEICEICKEDVTPESYGDNKLTLRSKLEYWENRDLITTGFCVNCTNKILKFVEKLKGEIK